MNHSRVTIDSSKYKDTRKGALIIITIGLRKGLENSPTEVAETKPQQEHQYYALVDPRRLM